MIYQILACYFNDNDADELTNEPIFKRILEKSSLASQPTLSRFFNCMDEDTLNQFNEICKKLRALVYKIKDPEMVLLDLDSTLLNNYGKQGGFATPDLFRQCEYNGVSYAIRLKANQNLYKLASHAEYKMVELTEKNSVDYAVVYDEFFYQSGSWDYPRRVVVKVEKPANQLTYQYTFVVTTWI